VQQKTIIKKINFSKIKQVYILCVGDELLDSTVLETNSNFLQGELYNLEVKNSICIKDKAEDIIKFLKLFSQKHCLIILIGGLGPTADDLTRFALAKFARSKLILNKSALLELKKYFKKRNYLLRDKQLVQAQLPAGAYPVKNNFGTACGIFLSYNNNFYLCLPGPPNECQNVFANFLKVWVKKTTPPIKLKKFVFNFFGIPESILEDKLQNCLALFTKNVKTAYLIRKDKIVVKVKIKATAAEINKKYQLIKKYIKDNLSEYFFGEGEVSLSEVVVKRLIKLNKTLAVAESITGGLVGDLITNISGSSKIFLGSAVTYSNTAKEKILKVRKETLKKFGAVSAQTAKEMAEGVLKIFKSDLAVSLTGLAGPAGGSKEKPIGLVYFGVATKKKVLVEKFIFPGDRILIKQRAANMAIYLVWKIIKS